MNANGLYLLITSFEVKRATERSTDRCPTGWVVHPRRRCPSVRHWTGANMSVTNPTPDSPEDADAPPEFELEYRYDDAEDPTEVTVFPGSASDDVTTKWITIAESDALRIEDVR